MYNFLINLSRQTFHQKHAIQTFKHEHYKALTMKPLRKMSNYEATNIMELKKTTKKLLKI